MKLFNFPNRLVLGKINIQEVTLTRSNQKISLCHKGTTDKNSQYIFFIKFLFRFINLVKNSNLEKRLMKGYVKRLRNKYLLKNIHLTCEKNFIPLNFISSHFDKLSQKVGDGNFNEINRNLSKYDINFGAEMFMALNSCPTFYIKLYWRAIYGNESRIAKFASNIIRKANDGFKVKAQKIFARISSVIGFQHISFHHEGSSSNILNIELTKNMDVKGN